MKSKKPVKDRVVYNSASQFANSIGVPEHRSVESKMKAKLVAAIRREIKKMSCLMIASQSWRVLREPM